MAVSYCKHAMEFQCLAVLVDLTHLFSGYVNVLMDEVATHGLAYYSLHGLIQFLISRNTIGIPSVK